MTSALQQRFLWHLVRICVLVLIGTLGFMWIEHWSLLDALFMTVETVTTVGYGFPQQISDAGRVFALVLMLTGVGFVLYILSDMVQMLLEANPTAIIGRRRMKEKIARLSNHQIVCGFGRTGQEVAHHFSLNRVPFVVVEADLQAVKHAEEKGCLVL
ncbi:MAG TPA: potassium channel family protein, partial [Candidatus Obscuribacterales bacterium]